MKNDIVVALLRERARQDAKWGEQNHGDDRWAVILGEEYGEVCLAINEGLSGELRDELIQVAAVAVAWLEALERR
jgi:NTP pyrophosphatase (non-canonical NTP hydrolase)